MAIWTIGLFPVVLLGLIAALWLPSLIPASVSWTAGLVVCIALELAYVTSALAAVAGAVSICVIMLKRGRGGWTAPWLVRGLVVCVSLLVAAAVAEAACAAWRVRAQRSSAGSARAQMSKPGPVADLRITAPATDLTLPTEFEDSSGDGDIDLVVVGESSAQGVPYDRWLTPGALLEWKLRQAIPGRNIRTNVVAISGSTLESQHRMLGDLLRRPEILVVYCGQAEIVNRLAYSDSSSYYFDELLPEATEILVEWVEQSSPVCGLLHKGQEYCRRSIPDAPRDVRKLIDICSYTQTEYTTLLIDFRRRLETIVSHFERLGTLPVLVVPASNDGSFEPNRSFLPAATLRSEREEFAREFQETRRLERTDPDGAIGRYRALLERQPRFAETHFRLGKLLEGKEEWEEAYRHYIAARDLDGFPTRTLTAFQNVYREVAARHDCILVDLQSYFHLIGRHGLLDDELFQDAMHLSLRGQIALAQAVVQALGARRAFGCRKDWAVAAIDPTECAERFNLKPAGWKILCHWGMMFGELSAGWRYDMSARLEKRGRYQEGLERLNAGAAPESLGLPNIGVPAPIPPAMAAQAAGPLTDRSAPKPPGRPQNGAAR
jgi:hypothetical protein